MSIAKQVRRAIDNGYNFHKVAWVENGKIRTLKYPAIVGSSSEVVTQQGGGFENMYETHDGERFVVSPSVNQKITVRTNDYGVTSVNRVLVNHGLKASGVTEDQEVSLITSLPVRDYYSEDGTYNEEYTRGQSDSMKHPVYAVLNNNDTPERIATVVNSRVISEAVAGAFDYLVPNVGDAPNEIFAPIAVLDFGGSTFDAVTLTPTLGVRQSSSGTLNRGTLDIAPKLRKALESHVKELGIHLPTIADWMLDETMASGKLPYFVRNDNAMEKRELPVQDLIDAAAGEVVSEIKAFVKRLMPNFSEYQAIILVGGGSLLCQRLFSDWESEPNVFVLDEFANARGMLKLMSV